MKGTHIMYERFVEILQEKNITPYKVAKETGVSQGSLSDWKHGRSKPKNDSMKKIADFLGVSLAWLQGDTDERYQTSVSITDDDIKVALFGGADDVTPEMWDEVKNYVEYIKSKNKKG